MKSIFKVILLCVLTMVLSLTAFGAAKKDKYYMALLDGTNANPWRTQNEEAMRNYAEELKKGGTIEKFDIFVANNDPALQAQQLEQLINAKVDVVFINPVSATSLTPAINKAKSKGILILGIDQHITNKNVISVSNDQYEWAKIQAEWFVKELNGNAKIIWVDALAGAPANDIRSKAFSDVLKNYPNIKVLKKINADWDQGKAKQLMTQMIQTYPEFDAVLNQDSMGVGILNAILEAKRPAPRAMTSDEVVQYLKMWYEYNQKNPKNKMNAIIVENPPSIGITAMKFAVRLLQGKTLKNGVLTADASEPNNKNALLIKPTLVITNENLKKWYDAYKNKPDTSYIDNYLSDEEVDKYFN